MAEEPGDAAHGLTGDSSECHVRVQLALVFEECSNLARFGFYCYHVHYFGDKYTGWDVVCLLHFQNLLKLVGGKISLSLASFREALFRCFWGTDIICTGRSSSASSE